MWKWKALLFPGLEMLPVEFNDGDDDEWFSLADFDRENVFLQKSEFISGAERKKEKLLRRTNWEIAFRARKVEKTTKFQNRIIN